MVQKPVLIVLSSLLLTWLFTPAAAEDAWLSEVEILKLTNETFDDAIDKYDFLFVNFCKYPRHLTLEFKFSA